MPLTVLSLFALSLVVGCKGGQQAAAVEERTLSIKAAVVRATDREITRAYSGSLEGGRQAVLYSKLAEAVDSIWVDVGDRLTAQQVVLSLDADGPTSQYRAAQASFVNAEKTYTKMAFLYKEGAVSESAFDDAKTAYEVAKANFEAASRLVRIETPIAGTVTSIDVRPGDFVAQGQRLATIAQTARIRARFQVNETELGFFRVGADVRIVNEALGASTLGKIARIASSADPTTRSYEVEAEFANSDGNFAPGMFVRIEFILDRLAQVLAVPRGVVRQMDNDYVIFVVKEGRAARRTVTLGADLTGDVVIASGLASGDTLVTLGQDYLVDGLKVDITEVQEMK
jgi:RND family efflux transporter MFP subunit